jgi:hypothetical protein
MTTVNNKAANAEPVGWVPDQLNTDINGCFLSEDAENPTSVYNDTKSIRSDSIPKEPQRNFEENADLTNLVSSYQDPVGTTLNGQNNTAADPDPSDPDQNGPAPRRGLSPSDEVNLPDPPIMNKDIGRYTYTDSNGQLIIDGISPNDIDQGSVGTCYFLAALSALAKTDPEFLSQSMRNNGDGTHSFRFYNSSGLSQNIAPMPVWIRVDDDVPTTPLGNLPYGHSENPNELWVALYEKAYASFKTQQMNNGWYTPLNPDHQGPGYDTIYSGYIDQGFEDLTGRRVATYAIGSYRGSWGHICSYIDKNRAVVASAPPSNELGTSGGHAYTVLDAYVENGNRYVVVRNPWGWDGNTNDGNPEDAILTMTYEDFERLFSLISICDL